MLENKPRPRGVYILPNLFTTASLFVAFLSVTSSMQGLYTFAAMAIILSALLDGLDGKVARLTNTSSDFGVQYDSLADLFAFGAAPAVLTWSWQLQFMGQAGTGIAFLFLVCAALRLARFNVQTTIISKKFFIGLPSPAAGGTMASFVLFQPYMPDFLLPHVPVITAGLCVIIPLLMVSRVRYYSFKDFGYFKKHPFQVLVFAILFMAFLFSNPPLWFFTFSSMFVLSGILYTFFLIPRRKQDLSRKFAQATEENNNSNTDENNNPNIEENKNS